MLPLLIYTPQLESGPMEDKNLAGERPFAPSERASEDDAPSAPHEAAVVVTSYREQEEDGERNFLLRQ